MLNLAAYGRPSLARSMVLFGLLSQFALTAGLIFLASGASLWVQDVLRGEGEAVAGAASLFLLLVLVAPAARGRRWALAATIPLQTLLVLGVLPFFLRAFPHPASFTAWLVDTTYLLNGILAVIFGVVAVRESLGKAQPVGYRVAGGLTFQGSILGAFVLAWLGMVTLSLAVAKTPSVSTALGGAPDDVVSLPMENVAFSSLPVRLRAGHQTAIVLVNKDAFDHSFDIDSLGVHVHVPGKSTAVALVDASAAGRIPFYCGVPGHRQAGMVGEIDVR